MKKAIVAATVAAALNVAALSVSAPAQAVVEDLIYCPGGYSAVATADTSCAFANNVHDAWYGQPGGVVYAYSPVTELVYTVTCAPGRTDRWFSAYRCTSVNSFGVVLVVYID